MTLKLFYIVVNVNNPVLFPNIQSWDCVCDNFFKSNSCAATDRNAIRESGQSQLLLINLYIIIIYYVILFFYSTSNIVGAYVMLVRFLSFQFSQLFFLHFHSAHLFFLFFVIVIPNGSGSRLAGLLCFCL